ncbi:MAG: hypothetical protein J6K04_04300 [Lachnospiraceae bacterium]|nr:hypothetical protein [Lachnospiraceae bacterium]
MKNKIVKISIILLAVCGLAACFGGKDTDLPDFQSNSSQEESAKEENQSSFSDLEDMEEITVEGNTVTVALLQDIPLPYRWTVTWQSECATLIEEYEVEDPANGSMFSSGSAPEYHVFAFELEESDLVQLELYNCWVVEPENLSEANGKRNFILEYVDGQWKVVSAESSN